MAPTKKTVTVNVDDFVRTRDALTTAFMGLSASIDRAVKAYVDHTQAVLDGDTPLNLSHLTQPFGNSSVVVQAVDNAARANLAVVPDDVVAPAGDRKRKRAQKPRDPNAPKRPLTAFFRYLQEQRPIILEELTKEADGQPVKPGDVMETATNRWNKLSPDNQGPYRAAYQVEMRRYAEAVEAYKASLGQAPPAVIAVANGAPATVAALPTDDADSDSDEDGDHTKATPAPPPASKAKAKPKAASPDAAKKTPKSAAAKIKPAEAAPAVTPKFSSVNPPPTAVVPVPAEKTQSPARKRKAGAAEGAEGEKKKRSRKSNTERDAANDAAAAAAQLVIEPEAAAAESDGKKSKKEKKKRNSEAAT